MKDELRRLERLLLWRQWIYMFLPTKAGKEEIERLAKQIEGLE